MATNNFIEFDTAKTDIQTDAEYAADSQRVNGVATGMARTAFHNKLFRQLSVMVAAIGQVIADLGTSVSDTSVSTLVTSFKNTILSPLNHLLSSATATLFGLSGTSANVDNALSILRNDLMNTVINALKTDLQLSLNSSNIDAWCDLLNGSSMLSASSDDWWIDSGQLYRRTITMGTGSESGADLGYSSARTTLAQAFMCHGKLTNVTLTFSVQMVKQSYPTDTIYCDLYNSDSSGKPTTLIATSPVTISGTAIASVWPDATTVNFTFAGVTLAPETRYAFVLRRSGAVNSSTYYYVRGWKSGVNTEGGLGYYGTDESAYSVIDSSPATVVGTTISYSGDSMSAIWQFTPTAPIILLAIVADVTLNSGSITWTVSDDGTNWVSVPTLNVKQAVNFDASALYVKCVITGNAVVRSMAVGGI